MGYTGLNLVLRFLRTVADMGANFSIKGLQIIFESAVTVADMGANFSDNGFQIIFVSAVTVADMGANFSFDGSQIIFESVASICIWACLIKANLFEATLLAIACCTFANLCLKALRHICIFAKHLFEVLSTPTPLTAMQELRRRLARNSTYQVGNVTFISLDSTPKLEIKSAKSRHAMRFN